MTEKGKVEAHTKGKTWQTAKTSGLRPMRTRAAREGLSRPRMPGSNPGPPGPTVLADTAYPVRPLLVTSSCDFQELLSIHRSRKRSPEKGQKLFLKNHSRTFGRSQRKLSKHELTKQGQCHANRKLCLRMSRAWAPARAQPSSHSLHSDALASLPQT